MPLLFAATLFVSAALMFLIEPMIAKMILPRFGGTPAVWNTCMVFFQAALLAGYGYAHVATQWLGLRRQAALHVLWLVLPVVFLLLPIGIAVDWTPHGQENPAGLLLGVLVVSIGFPFFVVATSAPLLQKWFVGTGHRAAQDPYFLYAASNLGSMLALLSYPILVEPNLTLKAQGQLWAVGYGVLALLTLACIRVVWKSPAADAAPARIAEEMRTNWGHLDNEVTWPRRLRWIALAFVPSSLMLGVTSYLSTDIAPIPLIWVVPLALYLLSFILVFSRLPWWIHSIFRWALPVLVLVLLFMMLSGLRPSFQKLIPVHLVVFFVAAMACHGELATSRPSPKHLTEFYLWMSVGGVLGGLFNALVAPMVFRSIQEYSLVMVLACMLMPGLPTSTNPWWSRALDFIQIDKDASPDIASTYRWLSCALDFGLAVLVGGLAWYLFWAFEQPGGKKFLDLLLDDWQYVTAKLANKDTETDTNDLANILQYGIPIVICYGFIPRPVRCGLAALALMLAHAYYPTFDEDVLHRERNFFGVLRVKIEKEEIGNDKLQFHELLHGTTLHGSQLISSEYDEILSGLPALTATTPGEAVVTLAAGRQYWADLRRQPLTYYYSTGPVGDLFQAFSGPFKKKELAFIGLGTGSLLAYGEPGQKVTVFEINPAIVRIAENPEYFTYASTCRADPWPDGRHFRLVMGDARISLEREADERVRRVGPKWVVYSETGEVLGTHDTKEEAQKEAERQLARFGIIMVDAFSSDAIPVHLITQEAIELYLRKLAPGGIIALHISNRYLDLERVTGVLAKNLNLAARIRSKNVTTSESREGKSSSTWVLLARDEKDLYPLTENPEWLSFDEDTQGPLWTDDFSNIWSIFRWKH
jgi:hypothetical protein